jgi:hypothetical protein
VHAHPVAQCKADGRVASRCGEHPEEEIARALEVPKQVRRLVSVVGVACGDDAAVARVEELEGGGADAEGQALPVVLGEGLAVELEVEVRAKAA